MQYAPNPRLGPSCCENLQIRPHHTIDSANSGVAVHLIHAEAPCLPALAQRLKGHVQTNLVAVLEGVGDGFNDALHTRRIAFDAVSLDSFNQSVVAEAHTA